MAGARDPAGGRRALPYGVPDCARSRAVSGRAIACGSPDSLPDSRNCIMTLAGRRALITGSNRGFGLAVARAFAAAGADVTMCARDAAALASARDEVIAAGMNRTRVLAVQADVTAPDAMTDLVARSEAEI